MQDSQELRDMEKRCIELSDKISSYLTKECEEHKYSAQEVYVGLKYTLTRLGMILGEEATRKFESSVHITDLRNEVKH